MSETYVDMDHGTRNVELALLPQVIELSQASYSISDD